MQRVAQRVGRTPAQVLLRGCLQHDVPVITKSVHRDRISENTQIFDFALSAGDIADLDALDQTHGTDRALECKWWPGTDRKSRATSAASEDSEFLPFS